MVAPFLKNSLSDRLTVVLGLLAYPVSASIRKAGRKARGFVDILAGSGVGVMLEGVGGGEVIRPALSSVGQVVVPGEVGA